MKKLMLAFFLFFSASTFATVKMAFLQLKHPDGRIVQFEKGGEFGHVAVSYKGQWLHAHPKRGVELIDRLDDLGTIAVILKSEEWVEPTDAFVESILGLPFSIRKAWDDERFSYCTKLIARYYDMEPKIMNFSSASWKGIPDLPRGQKGLSADDLYQALFSEGFFVDKSKCENALAPDAPQLRSLRAKFGASKHQN